MVVTVDNEVATPVNVVASGVTLMVLRVVKTKEKVFVVVVNAYQVGAPAFPVGSGCTPYLVVQRVKDEVTSGITGMPWARTEGAAARTAARKVGTSMMMQIKTEKTT